MSALNIPALVEKLGSKNRKEVDQAAAELVSIGDPAIQPLVQLLRREPCGTAAWNAADRTLATIVGAPTRKKIRDTRNEIYVYWIGAAIAGLIFVAIGVMAELGWVISLIMGLIVAYVVWAVVVSGWSMDDWFDSLMAVITAPFEFAKTVSEYKTMLLTREQLKQKYQLPA